MRKRRGARRSWRNRLARFAIELLLLAIAFVFIMTSARPLLPERAAPTAQDVGAGRAAYWQLRDARGNQAGKPISLTPAQLAGLSAVASHGFRPDQLRLSTHGSELWVEGSHHLPLGRWLNVTVRAQAPSKQFPVVRLKVGVLSLPPWLSRWSLEVARLVLRTRVPVPPLDRMVQNFRVTNGITSATVSLPGKMGMVDELAGTVSSDVDSAEVVRVYCTLAREQKTKPSNDFAEQVRRAFSMAPEGGNQAGFNRAAFVGLAMLVVDERVGDFARSARDDIGRCRTGTIHAAIYGREDWPKHWLLSSAIAVGAGVQLSEAAGEWKELADSLVRPQAGDRDPKGFSMADLAADRAGFLTAQAAVSPESAAKRLAQATPDELLPKELTEREDGLPDDDFVRRYGGVDDPRFKARLQEIDHRLAKTGLR